MNETGKSPDIDRRIALEARDWIVRLTSGNVSAADLQRFRAWRDLSSHHKQAFDRERVFWQQLQLLEKTPVISSPVAVRKAPIGRRGFLIGGGAIAAAIAFTAIPRLQLMFRADFSTAVGEMTDISLPDGSVASLNTDSAIAVNFTPELRLVELLKGEAEFKVQTGQSSMFRVTAIGGNSDAMDAIFCIKSFEDIATITALQGDIRVSGPTLPSNLRSGTDNYVSLSASQQTSYSTGGRPAAPHTVDTDMAMAWRKSRVIFEGMPFLDAVMELGRYVPEPIVMRPGVNTDMPVSAIFSTHEAFAGVEALAKTQGLVVRRIPGVIIFVG